MYIFEISKLSGIYAGLIAVGYPKLLNFYLKKEKFVTWHKPSTRGNDTKRVSDCNYHSERPSVFREFSEISTPLIAKYGGRILAL